MKRANKNDIVYIVYLVIVLKLRQTSPVTIRKIVVFYFILFILQWNTDITERWISPNEQDD